MGSRRFVQFVGALVLCAGAAVGAAAQDFQKSYNLGDGGAVEIANVSGDITLTGYEGSAVVVSAYKQGRDREQVEVEDTSTQGRVSLRAKYPENCNCDASVRFEVRVPRSASTSPDASRKSGPSCLRRRALYAPTRTPRSNESPPCSTTGASAPPAPKVF
jgi:hypothetical protein